MPVRLLASSAASAEDVVKMCVPDASFLFAVRSGNAEVYHMLSQKFEALHEIAPTGVELRWAFNWLWPRVIILFKMENVCYYYHIKYYLTYLFLGPLLESQHLQHIGSLRPKDVDGEADLHARKSRLVQGCLSVESQ